MSTQPKMKTAQGEAILSIFRFFCTLRFQILNSCISAKYCPIITNHISMEILFIQLSDYV